MTSNLLLGVSCEHLNIPTSPRTQRGNSSGMLKPGLYFVTNGIYQIRGFDLANMTIVQIPKSNGVIIIDCLTSIETARKAFELYQEEHRDRNGQDPEIKSLLYTHCHVDHFGGAQEISDIATKAGGIEGLQIIYQLTLGTEAPAEVNFLFPDYNALCMAENATHTLRNIQTLRGAPVRDARLWSRYLDESIALFGEKSDVVFSTHHWPTWNQDDEKLLVKFLSEQRDYYAYLHNETLRQLNDGKTPVEIAEEIQMLPNLKERTNLRDYYGSISHNVKAVHDRYIGLFDGNPASLWPLKPVDESTEFVKCMGGNEAVLEKAQEYRANKNLHFAATVLNKLVFATQSNPDEKDGEVARMAKEELAAVYTELGYSSENGTWRKIYLTAAFELENGAQAVTNVMAPQSLIALSLDELFDTIAVRIDGYEAFKQPEKYLGNEITINFMVTDLEQPKGVGAGWHLRLSNAALTGRVAPYVASPPVENIAATLTVWLNHKELVELVGATVIGKSPSLDQLTTSGDLDAWDSITSLIAVPNPALNIVTP
ncbi:beta-lactamase domain-containing protein [Penicillium vulpinum]|uniref:beta-lactamase domain-containing protein n=1 Tax=Penicillium vulpinum TaxID=29845 RepID=UPI00254741AA|nr:beta-lactamase domain-containing protein [Penicillium vulpinum]KAJ5958013.1 beta-lactamase domain-containing protein [Penicillium vulpinum]